MSDSFNQVKADLASIAQAACGLFGRAPLARAHLCNRGQARVCAGLGAHQGTGATPITVG